MLVPTGTNVGLTSVILGVTRAIKRKGIRLKVLTPIKQPNINSEKKLNKITMNVSNTKIKDNSLSISEAESLIRSNQKDILLEKIVAYFHKNIENEKVILIEGIIPSRKYQFANALNYDIAKTFNAEIIFVISLANDSLIQTKKRIELIISSFGGKKNEKIIGLIINKLNAPIDDQGRICLYYFEFCNDNFKIPNINSELLFSQSPLPVLGCIPWSFDLIATRAIDICKYLRAFIINKGQIYNRRIKSIIFCTNHISNIIDSFLPGSLLVISSDRVDILIASCLAAMNGIKIGAILLTGGYDIKESIKKFCNRAFQTGLPIFIIKSNTWQTALHLQNFNLSVPKDDIQRIEKVQEYIANYINPKWIASLTSKFEFKFHLSPPAFRYQITKSAQKANKCIILPESYEPRIIKAASICANRKIAKIFLLGNKKEIKHIAETQGISINKNYIKIINPKNIRHNYVKRLVELRKHKGMTEIAAKSQLKDNIVLATMMLEKNEVDGLVSGVVHTTAHTIRPALQLIKTAPNNSLVSSIFFMLLPEQVLVYGDCAINPDPTAEQLAEIAIQSAESAIQFGIDPKVAMISYSTGNSGKGSDVEKVRKATYIAQQKRPDLIIDGPLQYDAAIMQDVAKSKAPNSPVAGKATVCIFPDLNTGNTTYKAVQRSANLISIGPMLQGMKKPVNDLSRGASLDDIVYTIALTAIQALDIK